MLPKNYGCYYKALKHKYKQRFKEMKGEMVKQKNFKQGNKNDSDFFNCFLALASIKYYKNDKMALEKIEKGLIIHLNHIKYGIENNELNPTIIWSIKDTFEKYNTWEYFPNVSYIVEDIITISHNIMKTAS